mgnify:CR=1 FL=1
MKIGYRHWMMVAAGWLALTGCSDAMDPIPNPTPNPSPEVGREALSITATLSGSAVQTKAAGSNLAAGDVLYAYIRQVKPQEGSPGYTAVGDPSVESWVKLTVKGASAAVNPTVTPNRESTSSFEETVYWDDFSTTTHDLRTEGHALQSYYGYCYNGKEGDFKPNESEGKLTWSVAADQTGGYQKSDLLWSKAQTPVEYEHGTQGNPASHGTLTIPYTHAMSKVTVVVKTDDQFSATTALASTSAELTQVYLKGEMNAPEGTVVPDGTPTGTIKMYPNAEATAKTFEALMIPGLELTEGLTLAQINNVAKNNYKITITPNILDNWSSQLDEGKTMPGVNYKLTLTVKKQSVNIVASLTDWVNVEATGEGIVRFTNDVTSITGGTGGTQLTNGSMVDIFWVKAEGAELKTVTKDNYATTSTYNATDAKWTNAPALYWDNGTDRYYFRGLAKKEGDAIKSYKPASGSGDEYSFDVKQGTDLLWATTPKHTGQLEDGGTLNFEEGAAINPRTGYVPLRFDHAMSQISFKLQTTTGADKVELDGATLCLAQVVKKGTIEPANGTITPSAEAVDKNDLTLITASSIVVPQTLTDEMILTIQLNGNVSTYKIALKNCKLTDGTAVTKWEGGKHYTYTITLKKEAVQLIAFVKNWTEVNVSGDANLDWD